MRAILRAVGGFTTAGGAMTAAGLILGVRMWLFLRRAATAEGRVVSLEHHSGSNGPTYKPVVEYTAPDGAVVRFTESLASGRPRVRVGEAVTVRYDPGRPSRARLNKPLHLWFLPGFLAMMGVSFLAAGLV